MIHRNNRFHGHAAVARVRGKPIYLTHLSVRYAPNRHNDYRLAVVVSKKISKSAVVRNRIRRRVFECLRTDGRLSGVAVDVIVYATSVDLATLPHDQLKSQLTQAVDKILANS